MASLQQIREVVTSAPTGDGKPVEVSTTVLALPTTTPIQNMIITGQIQTSVNGIVVQNGLTTNQVIVITEDV